VGGGQNRAAAVLGADAGVGRAAVEVGAQAEVRRRGDDHLADRRRVVEDVAEVRPQPADVDLLGTGQRVLLGDREQQLERDGRALDAAAPRQLEQHGHRRLVVGAEDGVVGVLPAAVDEDGLDRSGVVDRVEMGAEQQRPVRAPADAGEQVAGLCAGGSGGFVLLDLDAHRTQPGGDRVRARPLVPERARDAA
jgi:hypothetical protein